MFLMSATGVHVPLPEKGDAIGMFVPSTSTTRRYTDIQNPSKGAVKAHVSLEGTEQPLWRMFDDRSVEYYGFVGDEITERRSSVSIYLPKDFLPEGYSVFYYVFDDRWVVYGERIISDEGSASWVYTKFDSSDEPVADFLIGVISDRLVKGVRERICVAVANCTESEDQMKEVLAHFDIEVQQFSDLKLNKVKPVYQHKDFGLFMLFGFFCGFVLMVATFGFYMKSYFELNAVKSDIAGVRAQIQQMQQDMVLGHVADPDGVLRFIEQDKLVQPSTILHETGNIGSAFGELETVAIAYTEPGASRQAESVAGAYIDKRRKEVASVANIKTGTSQLLVDQENVAQSLLRSHEYINEITRLSSDEKTVSLSIKMQLGERK